MAPLHPPEAVQVVAFIADQLKVENPLGGVMVVGLAENVTVGGGMVTVTVTLFEAVPPAPVHARV